MIKDVTLKTLEGKTIGYIKTMKYSISRNLNSTYVEAFFTPSKVSIAGKFTLSSVIHGDWILQHPLDDMAEEPLNIFCRTDGDSCIIENCFLFKDGSNLIYADLLNFVGELSFISDSFKVIRREAKEDPHKGMIYNAYNDTWSWL